MIAQPAEVAPWVRRFRSVRRLPAYVRDGRGIERGQHLAIGFWKRGMNETEHHDRHDDDRDAACQDAAKGTPEC
ncbi:siderophore-interacting protein [Roseomonas eburnea]|uniref:Siderophore-interacting protein n=1 Tax=Neoroseomonas eburnea TaxID=1346889 RepID=A0A9X9X9T0_9PROT|nr:hypothetical protein [Neoroseomonas eburnea]MBR0680466.1 siderophore-interacting protein [Neoroseomonas eburnea]